MSANGLKDATADEFQIHAWFVDNPTANVAVSTDGLIVIDRDTDKETGKKNSDFSPDQELDLAGGPHSSTPSGGDHNWFRQRPGRPQRNTTKKLGPHTDTRASGGYVLVYPSMVDGKPYTWQADNGLDVGPDQLPFAPEWIELGLDEQKPNVVASAQSSGVAEGGRNAHLASLGGFMRRSGLDESEILAALLVRDLKNIPPLGEAEVRRIAKSVSRYEPDQIATLMADGAGAGQLVSGGVVPFSLPMLDSKAFANAKYEQHYLCKNVLAANQPCMIGGPSKSLKTSIAEDLHISLGTGTPFLGHFEVPLAVPVGMISGESGLYTLQRNAKVIAGQRGIRLEDAQCFWGETLPQLSKPQHLMALGEMINRYSLKVVIVDPAYLALLAGDTQKRNASSMFDMGPLLLDFGKVGTAAGCTMILIHHNRKNMVDPFAVPELADMAFSGFSEWARQWILVNRRERYEQGTGLHRLWLNAGGSAGHSSVWSIDVDEGVLDENLNGRLWNVTVATAGEARQAARDSKAVAKQAADQLKAIQYAEEVEGVLRDYPDGLTITGLQNQLGRPNLNRVKAAVAVLRTSGRVEDCEIMSGKKKTPDKAVRISPQFAC